MNQLKPISDNEVTALKHAIAETYVGYIISAKHGIVRIGDVKNQISNIERKIADLRGKSHADFMAQTIQDMIAEHQNQLDVNTQLLEDIYAEVNASDDPRSMLNLKTLEREIAEIATFQQKLITKHEQETSHEIANIMQEMY